MATFAERQAAYRLRCKVRLEKLKRESAELKALDELIVRFTTNPVFRATNVVDVDLAKQASKDLSAVIERSKELKQRLRKFSKTTKPQ